MVGKWHLGFYEWEYTPTYRGFVSHYGFYTGCGDHYTHERLGILDLRDNTSPVRDMNGTYSANLFTRVRKIFDKMNILGLLLEVFGVRFYGRTLIFSSGVLGKVVLYLIGFTASTEDY